MEAGDGDGLAEKHSGMVLASHESLFSHSSGEAQIRTLLYHHSSRDHFSGLLTMESLLLWQAKIYLVPFYVLVHYSMLGAVIIGEIDHCFLLYYFELLQIHLSVLSVSCDHRQAYDVYQH